MLKFAKEKTSLLTELADICSIYHDHNQCQINQADSALLANKQEILQQLQQVFSQINNWQLAEIKQAVHDFSVKTNLKIKDFGIALRIALTFSSASAGGIFEILDILGKEEVLFRLNNAISI